MWRWTAILLIILLTGCSGLGYVLGDEDMFIAVLDHKCLECNDQPSGTPKSESTVEIPLTDCFEYKILPCPTQ
tara:strand:- start:67 stop:285 length:219 start_codon:yes stop_codon:yes gene_type:complete